MPTAECQSRILAEILQLIDGMFAVGTVPACRESQAFEVHLEHEVGLVVKLCAGHEQLAEQAPGYLRSVKLRPPS